MSLWAISVKKDLLNQLLESGEINIQTALRQPLILPDSTDGVECDELFRQSSADYALEWWMALGGLGHGDHERFCWKPSLVNSPRNSSEKRSCSSQSG